MAAYGQRRASGRYPRPGVCGGSAADPHRRPSGARGRLRSCGNDECRLFHLDRSRANTARWYSMKTCSNRLKARRHQERARYQPTT
ncbi:CGNR zinc finger domain-containing protein [Micromonospora sp. NPDC051196]|uniref:CGNR zinc finger domain-containing protein n=1 Tax=Micromonospora sp. NPDC051196 TaxID=3155281 RepID=UPI003425C554